MKIIYLIYLGIFFVIGSFLFDIIFIGIPIQDPTPEITARRNFHYLIKEILFITGISLIATGIISMVIKKLNRPS